MRKETVITLNDRGNELTFKIKEMSAMQLQKWMLKAGILLARSGVLSKFEQEQINEGNITGTVLNVISTRGISLFREIRIDIDELQALLDELLCCCYRVDGAVNIQLSPDIIDGMIEDVTTLFKLEAEAIKINFGFFDKGGLSDIRKDSESPKTATSKQKISMRSSRS